MYSSFAQIATISNYLHGKQSVFEFPIINIPNKTEATSRINNHLQMQIAEQTTAKTDLKNLFDKVSIQHNGQLTGLVGLTYSIHENNEAFMSLTFHGETEAAYPDYFESSYSFNTSTGDLILINDLFTQEGFKNLNSLLQKMRNQKVKKHVFNLHKNKLLEDVAQEDGEDEFLNELLSCINASSPYAFYLKNDSIHFEHPRCLPHVSQAFDGDFSVHFAINELKPYLNNYGKKLLVEKMPEKSNFHTSFFDRPLYGKIGNSPIVLLLNYPIDKSIHGYYYYLNQGKAIYFYGSIDHENVLLQCNDENQAIHETIKGKLTKSGFVGKWTNNAKPSKPLLIKVN